MLRARHLHFAFGARTILNDVSFEIGSRSKIALVGKNGAGKSTLLKIILGELKADSGELSTEPGIRVAALAQRHNDPPAYTVQQAIKNASAHVQNLETQLRSLETELHNQDQANIYTKITEEFERLGGYSFPARAAKTTAALALTEFLGFETSKLSGGERTRLALACALIGQPDLLILDEPTNHLDIEMRQWLEETLRDYSGAFVAVSHDRELLDHVAKQTLWLENGSLQSYKGGYSRAKLQRQKQREAQAKLRKLQSTELQRLDAASSQVARWGKNNDTLARRAKSIAARASRTREQLVSAPSRERKIAMALAAGDARAKLLLRAMRINKTFEHMGTTKSILRDVNFRLRAGDRVAILAKNGAGKSTLLKILIGELWPDAASAAMASEDSQGNTNENKNDLEQLLPEIRFSDGVLPAYFDQQFHGLQKNEKIFTQIANRLNEAKAKALLGRYGFTPEDFYKLPNTLSGGEAARAGLALMSATRADVLILDEPTNHLDVETVEVLEEALAEYPGSIVFVTHDRRFAEQVATRVMTIEDGNLIEFARGFEGYREHKRHANTAFINPGRLLDSEQHAPEPEEKNTEKILETLELRILEIEDALLLGGFTNREVTRLRFELDRNQDQVWELLSQLFSAPIAYSHRIRHKHLNFCSDLLPNNSWRFWLEDFINTCPEMIGYWGKHKELHLSFSNDSGLKDSGLNNSGLPWFNQALLAASMRLGFEYLGAKIIYPPKDLADPTNNPQILNGMLAEEYAQALGIKQPLPPHQARWRTHPDYLAWAAWRAAHRKKPDSQP